MNTCWIYERACLSIIWLPSSRASRQHSNHQCTSSPVPFSTRRTECVIPRASPQLSYILTTKADPAPGHWRRTNHIRDQYTRSRSIAGVRFASASFLSSLTTVCLHYTLTGNGQPYTWPSTNAPAQYRLLCSPEHTL